MSSNKKKYHKKKNTRTKEKNISKNNAKKEKKAKTPEQAAEKNQRDRVVKEMINIWEIDYTDFMGFIKEPTDIFTFHHLRIPRREGGPINIWNGAILSGNTAHPYLHTIERFDRDRFLYLTKILIEVNEQEYLPTLQQLRQINEALKVFEKEYCAYTFNNGKPIIKENYVRRLIP